MNYLNEIEAKVSPWINEVGLESFFNADDDEVLRVAEDIALLIREGQGELGKINENFSFIANSSLSGGMYPCSYPKCRNEKLNSLTSFASLYADCVHIQNPFEALVLNEYSQSSVLMKSEFLNSVFNFIYLKPALKAGIIKYAYNLFPFCKKALKEYAIPLEKKIMGKEKKLKSILQDHIIDKCHVTFDCKNGMPYFKISGPDEFLEHGERYFHIFNPEEGFVKHLLNKKSSYRLLKEEIIKEDILGLVIDPILRDLSNQEWHSTLTGTTLLCDNATQMHLASKLNRKSDIVNSNSFNDALEHHLPTIHSKNLDSIIKLRDQEKHAFKVYRDKINALLKDCQSWSNEDISEMFRDQVLPEINKINHKINNWKVKSKTELKDKLLFGSGALSFGLYSGLLPPDIISILAGIGGATAIASTLKEYNETLKVNHETRSNDLYFLWQANNS